MIQKRYTFPRALHRLLLAFLLLAGPVTAQAQLADLLTKYAVLETIIAGHKSQSNKLRDRVALRAGISASTNEEKGDADKFRGYVRKLDNRMNDLMSYATFAAEVAQLTLLVERVTKLEGRAIDLSIECSEVEPDFLLVGVAISNDFATLISAVVTRTAFIVTSGLKITMATQEQRQAFVQGLRKDFTDMQGRLNSFIRFAEGVRANADVPVRITNTDRFGAIQEMSEIKTSSFRDARKKLEKQLKELYRERIE